MMSDSFPETGAEVKADIIRCLAENDFIGFCKYIRIKKRNADSTTATPVSVMSFDKSQWRYEQKRFQKERTGRDIVLKPRRIGFSTLEFARDLFFALRNAKSKVVICATNGDLAKEMMGEVLEMYSGLVELDRMLSLGGIFPALDSRKPGAITKNQSKLLKFPNKSSIKVISAGDTKTQAANAARGTESNRLHCTEVAFWKHPDVTMQALLEVLDTAGECVIESTPDGMGNYFHRFIMQTRKNGQEIGNNGYKFHFFPWYMHDIYQMQLFPGEKLELTEAELELKEEAKRIYDYNIQDSHFKWYRFKLNQMVGDRDKLSTEYPADPTSCFIGSGDMFFGKKERDFIESVICKPIEEEETLYGIGTVSIYEKPQPSSRYLLVADIAHGKGGDNSCFILVNAETAAMAAIYATNEIEAGDFGSIIAEWGRRYNTATVAVENQGGGQATLYSLSHVERYPALYRGKNQQRGTPGAFFTSIKLGQIVWSNLKKAIASSINDRENKREPLISRLDMELAKELLNLAHTNTGTAEAKGKTKKGAKGIDSPRDDRADVFAVAMYIQNEIPVLSVDVIQDSFSFSGERDWGRDVIGWD